MANADTLNRLYEAFSRGDHATMAACYHPEATFRDPVFDLKGKEVPAMWHMFCERGKDLKLTWSGVSADEQQGRAHWEPIYTFSTTGRNVHNIIDGAFTFRDGLIHTHRDTFNFWRWSRQALGMPGLLLGWTPIIHKKVQATARQGLDRFIKDHPEYAG